MPDQQVPCRSSASWAWLPAAWTAVVDGRLPGRYAFNAALHPPPLCRFYTHLVEIPVAVLVGGTALQLWFALWRDVLPFAAYRHATEQEGGSTAAQEAAAQGEAAAEQAPAAAGGTGPPAEAT